MPLQFTRADTVTAGQKMLSRHARSLSRSVRDRMTSGIGDWAYRVGMYWFNLFRQPRNPSSNGLTFPAQGEFFDLPQHVDPEEGGGQWPTDGSPGDFEGANLANPMMQFAFGSPVLDPEDIRLGADMFPLWGGNAPPGTLRELWDLGKLQRGVYAPLSGLQNVPALEAAQSWLKVSTDYYSPHGKSWGGYFPTPTILLDDCGSTETTGLGVSSAEVKFSALRSDASTASLHGTITTSGGKPVCTYAGSCPAWSESVDVGHVQWILRMPLAYYVGVWNGTGIDVDRFDLSSWIEGPYTGQGVLSRQDGGQLQRAVWAFACDFRGTEDQRVGEFDIRDTAFDFQDFFTSQYLLSPSYGVKDGALLKATYPSVTIRSRTSSGETLPLAASPHEGFIICGAIAHGSGLVGSSSVEFLAGDTVLATAYLEPDADGNAEAVVWWDPGDASSDRVTTRSATGITLTPSGSVTVELAELYAYKPQFWDAYLVLRLSATAGGDQFGPGVDGSGRDYGFSAAAYGNYSTYGAIYNPIAAGPRTIDSWITDNPVYDSVRRLCREHFRIARRQTVLGYHIDSDGRSVVRFKRWAFGQYNTRADLFKDIAPKPDPVESGALEKGQTYDVVSGSGTGTVTYKGSQFRNGQTITCTDTYDFTTSGDAALYEHDGIRSTATAGNWTREWVAFTQLHFYHPAYTSQWNRDGYADYYAWCNRCLTRLRSGGSTRFNQHVNYNHRVSIEDRPDGSGVRLGRMSEAVMREYVTPEAPTGYTYAENANRGVYMDEDFALSCPIYQAPYEILSCTSDHAGRNEVVTVTFKGRWQHVSGADSTFGQDPTAWDAGQVSSLVSEAYRTDDNAMRDYVRSQAVADYPCPWRKGDAAAGSLITSDPDNPFGACNPHIMFVRLPPEPYLDDNEREDKEDSRTIMDLHRMIEVYLRAGCEGFMDGRTSEEITCETGTGSLYDYTFENLCFDAFGGRSCGAFSTEDRSDLPPGFGPLPNTYPSAEVHNRLAKAVNLLTKARVMVPFSMECNSASYSGSKIVSKDWGDTCSGSGAQRAIWSGTPPDAGTFVGESGWGTCTSATASTMSRISGCAALGQYEVTTFRTVASFRVSVDPDFESTMSADLWAACTQTGQFLIRSTTQSYTPTAQRVSSAAESSACGNVTQAFWDGSVGYEIDIEESVPLVRCFPSTGSTYDAGPRGPSTTYSFCRDTWPNEYGPAGGTDISLELMGDPGFWVTIPLVDLEGD